MDWVHDYNDEMKAMITSAFRSTVKMLQEGVGTIPTNQVVMEGVSYTPQQLLEEVEKRTEIGEKVMRQVYDRYLPDLENMVNYQPSNNEPIVGVMGAKYEGYGTFVGTNNSGSTMLGLEDMAKMIKDKHEMGIKMVESGFVIATGLLLGVRYE